MLFYHGVLFFREADGLLQDTVGYAYLAYIVQQGPVGQGPHLFLGQGDLAADAQREAGYGPQVLLDVGVFGLHGLDERLGYPQDPPLALEFLEVMRVSGKPGDAFGLFVRFLQGAYGRVEYRVRVPRLGDHPAHGGRGKVTGSPDLLRDVLLERAGDPAGPALVRAAKDDDELFVPVAERALPAVPELLADLTEKDVASAATPATKPCRMHRQDRERPAVGELLPQDASQRRPVGQTGKLVQPARGVRGVLQGGGYLPGQELQGPLLLGAILPAADDHGPPSLLFVHA